MTQDEFELARLDDAHSLTAAPPGQTDPFKALPERQFEDLVSVARLVGRSRGAALRFWCGGRAWTGAAIGVTEEELARLDFAVRVQACARPAIAFPAKNTRECLFALAAPLELGGGLAGAVLLIDDEPRRHDLETTAAIERIASALAPRVNAEADERLAAALLRGAPDAILSIRADLGIDYRNQSAEKLFGEAVTTRPAYIDVIFPEDVREASRRRLADSIATLGPGQAETMQFVGLRADGRVFPMELTLCAVPDAVYGRLSLVVRDCTQRFAAESALKAAKSAAEAASRAKTSFLANISHELQTPLNGVIGLLDGLDLSTLADRQAEAVGLALASGRDLQSLVADVLELTRLESDAEPVRAVDFDLPAFGASLASAFAEAARRKGLDLKVEIAPDARLRVSGDADKLGRMLARLLDNAIKFTAQGHVRLAISRASPTHFSFEVSDSGVGFAADIAPRLFNAFEQAELGLTRRFSGAGLGLALCREIADLLGAEIKCGSAPGCGAEFHINVPLDVEGDELAEPSVPFRAEARAPGRPLRVLIADDNAVNRQVLEAILATVDAEVAAAGDGAEALDAVRRELFDLILMDMMMPMMDGLSATQAIRSLEAAEQRPRTPVIMVSANTLPEHIDAARLAGVDHYLTKPVGARQLLEAVAELLAEPMMAEPLELAQAS